METDGGAIAVGSAIVSALCWVDRGYAKAVLEEY